MLLHIWTRGPLITIQRELVTMLRCEKIDRLLTGKIIRSSRRPRDIFRSRDRSRGESYRRDITRYFKKMHVIKHFRWPSNGYDGEESLAVNCIMPERRSVSPWMVAVLFSLALIEIRKPELRVSGDACSPHASLNFFNLAPGRLDSSQYINNRQTLSSQVTTCSSTQDCTSGCFKTVLFRLARRYLLFPSRKVFLMTTGRLDAATVMLDQLCTLWCN